MLHLYTKSGRVEKREQKKKNRKKEGKLEIDGAGRPKWGRASVTPRSFVLRTRGSGQPEVGWSDRREDNQEEMPRFGDDRSGGNHCREWLRMSYIKQEKIYGGCWAARVKHAQRKVPHGT